MSVMFDPEAAIYPFPPKPMPLNRDEKHFYREKIKRLLRERDAVMVAHYYTDPEIQQLAEETGGCISDSWRWRASAPDIPPQRCWLPACALWEKRQKSSVRKNHPDAHAACGVFARSGLSDRGV